MSYSLDKNLQYFSTLSAKNISCDLNTCVSTYLLSTVSIRIGYFIQESLAYAPTFYGWSIPKFQDYLSPKPKLMSQLELYVSTCSLQHSKIFEDIYSPDTL